jgi:hypothetical protein
LQYKNKISSQLFLSVEVHWLLLQLFVHWTFQVKGIISLSLLSRCFVYKTGCIAGHIAFAWQSLHQNTSEVAGNCIWFNVISRVTLQVQDLFSILCNKIKSIARVKK